MRRQYYQRNICNFRIIRVLITLKGSYKRYLATKLRFFFESHGCLLSYEDLQQQQYLTVTIFQLIHSVKFLKVVIHVQGRCTILSKILSTTDKVTS